MPYVYKKFSRVEKAAKCYLPVQKTIKQIKLHRVSVSTSNRGSATVEAVFMIPIFIFVVTFFMYLVVTVNLQNNIFGNLYNISQNIGENTYLYEKSGGIELLTKTKVYSEIYNNEFRKYINDSIVLNGTSGIRADCSIINNRDKNEVLMKLAYKVKYLIGTVNYEQALCIYPWIGESIKDSSALKKKTVFVAENGKVYHLDRNCSHLQLSTKKTSTEKVDELRNSAGGKYKPCEMCVDIAPGEGCVLYITDDGNRYHIYKSCSGLKRTVYEIELEKVGNKNKCLRCGK